jgi:spore germination protein YaaH
VQNNHTGLLQTIANNTATTTNITNITTLATAAKQDQQNANLSLIANQTQGVALATHQVNQTTLLTNLTTAAANQSTSLTTLTNQTAAAIFRTDNTPTLTTLGSTGAWIDAAVNGQTKFELVLALGTAATVPVVALQTDYSTDGTAIVETTQTLTGVASSAVSLGGIECKPTRVRCVVKTAGVALGTGAKVIITGSK